jgi:hypothetical protein
MPALVAGIHALLSSKKGVDGRDKPGHDEQLVRRKWERTNAYAPPRLTLEMRSGTPNSL